jgi:hypothetical protein
MKKKPTEKENKKTLKFSAFVGSLYNLLTSMILRCVWPAAKCIKIFIQGRTIHWQRQSDKMDHAVSRCGVKKP